MKKRIVALLMTIVIFSSLAMPAGAISSSDINGFLERMLELDVAERESYLTLIIPMFMVDSGVDDLKGFVKNYESDKEDSFINVYIGKILQYTDKETLTTLLETIKCTNVQARRNFLNALKNKETITVSAKAKTAITTLLDDTYKELPALKKLLEEGNYSTEAVAKLIKAIVEINDSEAFYAYNGKNFTAGEVDASLKTSINKVWEGYVLTEDGPKKKEEGIAGEDFDADEILVGSAAKLNEYIPSNKKTEVAEGLSELGVVKITAADPSVPSIPSDNGSTNEKPNPIVTPVEVPAKDIEVEITIDAGQTKKVEFETKMKLPVLYKKDGENLVIVKYSALSDGKLIAEVSESGSYVIKEASEKFNDCDGWAKDYIEMLAARGIINGKAQGVYAPNDVITREEFVKLVVELLNIASDKQQGTFKDVKADAWYAGYVSAAYEQNIVSGVSETEFGVGAPIRRQDMAKIINTVLIMKGIKADISDESAFTDFAKVADYAKEHVLSMHKLGIISGDENKNFNPDKFATRAEAAKMVYGMLVQIINN